MPPERLKKIRRDSYQLGRISFWSLLVTSVWVVHGEDIRVIKERRTFTRS